MLRLSFLLCSSVFFDQVLAATLHPRTADPVGWTSFRCLEDGGSPYHLPLLNGASYDDHTNMTIESCAAFCDSQSVSYRFMALTDGSHCSCDNFFEYIFQGAGNHACSSTPCSGDPSEVDCGGPSAASTYQKTDLTFVIPTRVPSADLWKSKGCYSDSPSARALHARVDAGDTTVESCVAACEDQQLTLAGVEFGQECWCGSEIENGQTFVGNDDGIKHGNFRPHPDNAYCNMPCQGNPTELCGGAGRLNVYKFKGTYPIGAFVVKNAGGWKSHGCYSDSTSSRTLERRVDPGDVTVESCVSTCQSQSFTIAGLEFGQECWCGNQIQSPGASIPKSSCNKACSGDSTEVCGGPDALQIYY
ncbi:WSC domain-containing protein [Lactarius sanguifluus]|nr:WSC domain-containing protein [Lactarius sanguifluus]